MKKINFLRLALIILAVVCLALSFKAIFDNDESTTEILCDNSGFFSYLDFLSSPIRQGVFYAYNNDFTYPESLVSYLAGKEKSPPLAA